MARLELSSILFVILSGEILYFQFQILRLLMLNILTYLVFSSSHCLYIDLNGKKLATSNLLFQAF